MARKAVLGAQAWCAVACARLPPPPTPPALRREVAVSPPPVFSTCRKHPLNLAEIRERSVFADSLSQFARRGAERRLHPVTRFTYVPCKLPPQSPQHLIE